MKLDNFRLIVEVGKRRALWDSTMQMALRKDAGTVQWQEVADIMEMDVNTCKKRFKGLRDSYRAEVRKIQRRRIDHSNWPYFRSLEFLRIIFDPEKLVPFSPVPFNIENNCPDNEQNRLDDFIIDVDNDDSFDFEIMGDIFKRDTTDTHDSGSNMSLFTKNNCDMSASNLSMPPQRSDVETSPTLLSPIPRAPPAKRARRKTSSSTEISYVNDRTTPPKTTPGPASDLAKDDPDYNFLVSMLPHMKTLSSMNNMKFRAEVSRILMDLNQQEQESDHLHKPTLAKIVQSPLTTQGYQHDPESIKNNMSSAHNAREGLAQSSLIECDVKIENEQLY